MASKPQPQPKHIVCSECGLAWEGHKATKGVVELTECVRLLKAELAGRPQWSYTTSTGATGGVIAIN